MTMQTAPRITSIDRRFQPAALYLVSIDSLNNRYRFYRMQYQRTLWGEDVIVQTWGPQGTDGWTRVQFLKDREHMQAEMVKLLRRRLQHGYEPQASFGYPPLETAQRSVHLGRHNALNVMEEVIL